ncbi:hypothetical protein S245_059354, partial [Arachis hypogaea]
ITAYSNLSSAQNDTVSSPFLRVLSLPRNLLNRFVIPLHSFNLSLYLQNTFDFSRISSDLINLHQDSTK